MLIVSGREHVEKRNTRHYCAQLQDVLRSAFPSAVPAVAREINFVPPVRAEIMLEAPPDRK